MYSKQETLYSESKQSLIEHLTAIDTSRDNDLTNLKKGMEAASNVLGLAWSKFRSYILRKKPSEDDVTAHDVDTIIYLPLPIVSSVNSVFGNQIFIAYEILGLDREDIEKNSHAQIIRLLSNKRAQLLALLHSDKRCSGIAETRAAALRDLIIKSYDSLEVFYKIKKANEVKFFNRNWAVSGVALLALAICLIVAPVILFIISLGALVVREIKELVKTVSEESGFKHRVNAVPGALLVLLRNTLLVALLSTLIFALVNVVTIISAIVILPISLFRLVTTPVGLVYKGAKLVKNKVQQFSFKSKKIPDSTPTPVASQFMTVAECLALPDAAQSTMHIARLAVTNPDVYKGTLLDIDGDDVLSAPTSSALRMTASN